MAAFLNRGLGRVAMGGSGFGTPIDADGTDLGSLTIDIGGAPGGTQFVKLDATVSTYIDSPAGCPCSSGFSIEADDSIDGSGFHYLTNDTVSPVGWGFASGAITWVAEVPTGTTQTFRVIAQRSDDAPTTGSVEGHANLTAATAAFGSTGSSTLGAKGSRQAQSIEG